MEQPPLSTPTVNRLTDAGEPARGAAAYRTQFLDRTLRGGVLVACCTIACLGLYAARMVVVPMLLALCLTLAVQPLIGRVEQRAVPCWVASTVGMVAILGGVGLFFLAFLYGANQSVSQWPQYEDAAVDLRRGLTVWLARHGFGRRAVKETPDFRWLSQFIEVSVPPSQRASAPMSQPVAPALHDSAVADSTRAGAGIQFASRFTNGAVRFASGFMQQQPMTALTPSLPS